MAHFAEINDEGLVLRVITSEQRFIDSGMVGDPNNWIQTSYNTNAGKHKDENLGKKQLRKNFAGIGGHYDKIRDAFYSKQPYNSWILNDLTCIWEAPILKPDDGKVYKWNEELGNWIRPNK